MKKILKLFYDYLFLILFAFGFEFLFNKFSNGIILNVIENILFAILLILPIHFIGNKKLLNVYQIIVYTFFALIVYLETVYYYLFKTYFSASAIFVSLDTNSQEAKEFISFYFDRTILVFSIIFFILSLAIILIKKKLITKDKLISKKSKLAIVGSIMSILILLKFSALIVYNLPYLIIRSSYMYKIESDKLGNYKESKNGNFINVKRISEEEEEVYVIIIGESTSRSHLGIYDYYRQTTPELEELKNELLIYKDVISPHVYSVAALTKILTLGNYENPEKASDGSIIQLINSAGLETYWLSNQRPIGQYESLITKISLSATEQKFLTTTIAGVSKVLDGELLKEFEKVLKNPVKKKVIFLHFMGTHHHYENRYPESFKKFLDTPKTKFSSDNNNAKINHYDNAIFYNDFLISQVIKKVDSLNKKSFVLYFSDHGEEMFDDLEMAGHNEDIYSKNMFNIPFFLWQSKEYKCEKKLLFVENRKYMIDDLIDSMADLLNISADEIDLSRSIFSESFTERNRIIKDTVNYDTYFN
jgi:heptose-I-phosphate ethanolaminephosphotransferase